MACFDAIIVILARPTMPCIHLVMKPYRNTCSARDEIYMIKGVETN